MRSVRRSINRVQPSPWIHLASDHMTSQMWRIIRSDNLRLLEDNILSSRSAAAQRRLRVEYVAPARISAERLDIVKMQMSVQTDETEPLPLHQCPTRVVSTGGRLRSSSIYSPPVTFAPFLWKLFDHLDSFKQNQAACVFWANSPLHRCHRSVYFSFIFNGRPFRRRTLGYLASAISSDIVLSASEGSQDGEGKHLKVKATVSLSTFLWVESAIVRAQNIVCGDGRSKANRDKTVSNLRLILWSMQSAFGNVSISDTFTLSVLIYFIRISTIITVGNIEPTHRETDANWNHQFDHQKSNIAVIFCCR